MNEPKPAPNVLANLTGKGLLAGVLAAVGGCAVILISILGGIALIGQQQSVQNANTTGQIVYTNPRNGARYRLAAEVVSTPAALEKGLMGRTYLADDFGMLFVFSDYVTQTFWMKDTLVSLDIIFLDAEQKVITIHQSTLTNQTNVLYTSSGPVKYTLETKAGWASKTGLQVGDYLTINF